MNWTGCAAILAAASCQNLNNPKTAVTASPQPLTGATPLVSGPIGKAPPAHALIDENAPGRVGSHGNNGGAVGPADITLNFVDVDIREVARTILGQILKVNYTIDPNVHGTTTIETPAPIRRDQLIPTLLSLLNQNGATLLQQDGMYRVLPSATPAAAANLVGLQNNGVGTELVPLTYASARELAKVLTPYIGEGAKVTADASRNALIVSGDPNARRAVNQMIRAFDIDVLAGQSYALLPVASDDPSKLATELQKALHADTADSPFADLIRVIPMERVNAILVVAARPRFIDDAKRIFSLIERGRAATQRSWHVYYVQNGQSNDLANLLQRAFTPGQVSAMPTPNTAQQGGAAPSLGQGSTGIGSGSSSGGSSSIPGLTTPSGFGSSGTSTLASPSLTTGQSATGGAAAEPLSTPESGNGGQSDTANTLRILADTRVNAVLIYATENEESVVESMLHKVDVLPQQIRIDATIAEVTLNDTLKYGTQFFFKSGGLNGALNNATSSTTTTIGSSAIDAFPSIAGNFPGFVLAKASSAVQGAISALQAVTTVKVLSSPELLVLNNQQALLQVGDLVPYLSATSTSTITANSAIVDSINYQQTGVILSVTPRIDSTGHVTIDVDQQVSNATTTSSSTIQSPTFQQREVRSRVIVEDGQTLGLAGLISDNTSRDNSGLPYLKDIPILGSLFSTQENTRTRQELVVMITPHIIDDERSAWALTEDLRAKLGGAAVVPAELQSLPASGSANPNGEAFRP